MNIKLLVPKNLYFGKCPKCKQEMTLERAKTNSKLERILLSIIRYKKYHCKSCKWYGNIFMYSFSKNLKRVLLNYLIIILIFITASYLLSLIVKKLLLP
jgi:hypothetical protein